MTDWFYFGNSIVIMDTYIGYVLVCEINIYGCFGGLSVNPVTRNLDTRLIFNIEIIIGLGIK